MWNNHKLFKENNDLAFILLDSHLDSHHCIIAIMII